jgi:oxygen-dependent protoporphyrinogen oxidase
MTLSVRPEVVVVGAGVAGLCAAYELTGGQAGPSDQTPVVTVIDAAPVIGGKLQPIEIAGRTVDAGPDGALARRPEVSVLCRELGLADHLVPIAAQGASVYARGEVRTLPEGLQLGIPTDTRALRESGVLSLAGYLRVLRDRFAPVPASRAPLQDRAIGSLVETKLGKEVVETLVDPMLGGINAGRVAEMSAAAIFPPLLEAAQQRGSLMEAMRAMTPPKDDDQPADEPPAFASLDLGMHALVSTLADTLAMRGVHFILSTPVTQITRHGGAEPRWSVDSERTTTRADGIVLALPGSQAAVVVDQLDDELATLLRTIDYASVAIATLIFAEGDINLPETGTGVLVPPETPHPGGETPGQRFLTTALTFLDRKWPHLKVDGTILLRVHMGRIDDPRTLRLSDDELVALALEELGMLLDHVGAPQASAIVRWESSLPQYQVNHLMRVAGIEGAVERYPALAVAGAAYRGVGVPACIASGRAAGVKVREAVEALQA